MTPENLWVLVCDGGRSFAYSNSGPSHTLRLVAGSELQQERSDGSPNSQRATAFASKGSAARHGVGEHEPADRTAERAFLKSAIDWLAPHEAQFERLVIAAPPRAMGEIRKLLPAALARKLAGEVTADLTKASLEAIAEHVSVHVKVRARPPR